MMRYPSIVVLWFCCHSEVQCSNEVGNLKIEQQCKAPVIIDILYNAFLKCGIKSIRNHISKLRQNYVKITRSMLVLILCKHHPGLEPMLYYAILKTREEAIYHEDELYQIL